eukprot:c28563_g1_i1 orf=218-2743(+)
MNFLLRHSFSSSDLPLVSELEKEGRASSEAGGYFHSPVSKLVSGDAAGEDSRVAIGGGVGDAWRSRNRMVIEDHTDVPADEGGILIPCRELPAEWHFTRDVASLISLDRGFVFPGEQLHIIVYVSSDESSTSQVTTPFNAAALMSGTGVMHLRGVKKESEASDAIGDLANNIDLPDKSVPERLEGAIEGDAGQSLGLDKIEICSESLLTTENHKKRSASVLESFQNSHFFTRIAGADEPLWKKRTSVQYSEEFNDGKTSVTHEEYKRPVQFTGASPILIENGLFDPKTAGGVARNVVAFHSFENGDIAVVLHVTVATNVTSGAVLEVLQFEKPGEQGMVSVNVAGRSSHNESIHYSDPSEQLLQWLFPLDRPSSPPISLSSSTPVPLINNSPQKISAAEDWDRPAVQKMYTGQDIGNEGLLSFRGAQLEPQRFSVHCGMDGLYVPGKRWRRKLEIVQPVAIESYFADCSTEDLICVLIENIVPANIPNVVIIVDSISIVCQSSSANDHSLRVPITCVEVGEKHKLPGVTLRVGEQHSFILKPTSPEWKPSNIERDNNGQTSSLYGHELKAGSSTPVKTSLFVGGKNVMGDASQQDSENYALIVSCRCSHTESRLHFKHDMQWRPRAPRDLLLSVSLEPSSAPAMLNGILPQLLSKALTVQATNLTLDDLNLTLHAPSSRNESSQGGSLPINHVAGIKNGSRNLPSGKIGKALKNADYRSEDRTRLKSLGLLQRSLSLPPARPIESIMGISPRVVKERAISAADIAAEHSIAKTHLWLQSTVPLGCVPALSTAAVKCELLPLTDGIITLDTLHISSMEQGVLYIPEKPLQVYTTSGIATGLS